MICSPWQIRTAALRAVILKTLPIENMRRYDFESIHLCGCSVRDVRLPEGDFCPCVRLRLGPSYDEVDVFFVVQHDPVAHPVEVYLRIGVDVYLDVAGGYAQVGGQFFLAEPYLWHGHYLSDVPCACHVFTSCWLVCHTSRRRCPG